MAYEYLVASLPMIFFEDPPPFSSEAFRAKCAGDLSPGNLAALDRVLSGAPPADSAGVFERAWYARQTQMDNETAARRAARRGIDLQAQIRLRSPSRYDASLREAVTDAFERPTPAEREKALDRARWRMVEELTAGQTLFGVSAVLAYGIKLRILERWAARTDEAGQKKLAAWMEGTGDE